VENSKRDDNDLKARRVCVMSSVHPVYDTRIYYKEILSLKKKGLHITYINREKEGFDRNGVYHVRLEVASSRIRRMLTSFWKMYKLAINQDDEVYHFHDPELLLTGLLLRLRGKKVIYDVHEDVPRQILHKQYLKPFIRPFVSALFEFFEKLIARRFSAIITATPKIESVFKSKRINAVSIKNYPKIEEFVTIQSKPSVHEKDGMCYVGGIREDRGIFEMLEACALGSIKLTIAGRFDSPNLEEKCKASPYWGNVDFRGYVGREEVADVMTSSLAGLMVLYPTNQYLESLPIKMFEYMAAGIPVIGSDFPLWKGILADGRCGVCVNPRDISEIVAAIRYYGEKAKRHYDDGNNGRKLVETKYNWGYEEKKLIELYTNILSDN